MVILIVTGNASLAGLTRLLVTARNEKLAAIPPLVVCNGLVAGNVYDAVIISPYLIALERVN